MTLEEKQNKLYMALIKRNGLQYLTNTISEIYGNPIQIFDRGVNVVSLSDNLNFDERRGLSGDNKIIPDDLKTVVMTGDYQKVYSSDTPVIGKYPFSPYRFLAARIRNKDAAIGHLIVVESQKTFTEEDVELLPMVCQTVCLELIATPSESHLTSRFAALLKDIIFNNLEDLSEINRRSKLIEYKYPTHMQLLLIRTENAFLDISPRYILNQLERGFSDGTGFIHNDEIVYIINSNDYSDNFFEKLSSVIFLELFKVGISRPFDNLEKCLSAYIQAEAAIIYRKKNAKEIVCYDEVICQHMLSTASKTCNSEVFRHPAIKLIKDASEDAGADYLNDLKVYLFSGRSATKTARMLHVHKNTVYYRLEIIQKAGHIDLSDENTCFLLQLDIMLNEL